MEEVNTHTAAPKTGQISFVGLFGNEINGKTINKIEIPLIQRDYAQGRQGEIVSRIRERFLRVLLSALLPDASPINLDFIYGDVTEKGTLLPLDGQQRLTTLFLLHWYVAQRAGVDCPEEAWTCFSYETRSSARNFCQFLVSQNPEWTSCEPIHGLSDWLQDQSGYFLTWKHDPTIQSMLIMLDKIHETVGKSGFDFITAWRQLSNMEAPTIRFNLLPMTENGLTDSLYIKMNSRGKPLTEFENFKAEFEGRLKRTHPELALPFALKTDTQWADVLWEYRGNDSLVDDEFMRYFTFITDIFVWYHDQLDPNLSRDDLEAKIYGEPQSEPIHFLMNAFDIWINPNGEQSKQTGYVKEIFKSLFTIDPAEPTSQALLLFSTPGTESETNIDLFGACCKYYAEGSKLWSHGNTLLLYAVITHLMSIKYEGKLDDDEELLKRLRIVRNLIEASSDELAVRQRDAGARFKNLLTDVRNIICDGELQSLSSLGFNQEQIQDEIRKKVFLKQHPHLQEALFALEDHPLLRGGLTAFTLDAESFAENAAAFPLLFEKSNWLELTGALLTKDNYGRHRPRGDRVSVAFGSSKNAQAWQDLFRGRNRENPHTINRALMEVLKDFHGKCNSPSALVSMQLDFLSDTNTLKDWRYYFVKYPVMRSAPQGAYTFEKSRYRACKLEGKNVHSFHDPYLLALVEATGSEQNAKKISAPWPFFYGLQDESGERALKLKRSQITLACVKDGWKISLPNNLSRAQASQVESIFLAYKIGDDNVLRTIGSDDTGLDITDRIEIGEKLLRDLFAIPDTEHI